MQTVESDVKQEAGSVETSAASDLARFEAVVSRLSIDSKTWYEKHVTGIVAVGAALIGGLVTHVMKP